MKDWLEKQRENIRAIYERENIEYEDELFYRAERLLKTESVMCPSCGKTYKDYGGVITHIQTYHRNLFRAWQILREEKALLAKKIAEQKKQETRKYVKPSRDEIFQSWWADEMGRISLHNKLTAWEKNPTIEDKADRRNQSLLVEMGLLKKVVIGAGKSRHIEYELSMDGEDFLVNPPMLN